MELKFIAPVSFIGPLFWEELYKRKMNEFKLNDSEKVLKGFYSLCEGIVRFESNSFTANDDSNEFSLTHSSRSGILMNVNTIDDFPKYDKKKVLNDMSSKLIAYIADGSAIEDPTLLFQFFMLTFADLKSYKFTYWYCAPTLVPEVPFQASENKTKNFRDAYPDQLVYLYKNLLEYWSLETISSDKPHCKQICMIETQNSSQEPRIVSLRDGWARRYDHGSFIVLFDTTLVGKDSTVSSSSVSSSTSEFQGSHSDESTFGWSTRNALSLLALSHDQSSTQSYINIVSVRGPLWEKLLHSWTVGQKDSTWRASVDSLTPSDTLAMDKSLVFQLDLSKSYFTGQLVNNSSSSQPPIRVVGWELNERGKPGPRIADLSRTLDPRSLMNQAVDLNISLMKWRLWPELNTNTVSSTKCLLFGAGTLGCAVARTLVGWGVRHITFIDNGIVSYSNPARQCLFEFSDCVEKRSKAIAAAHGLQRVFPGIQAQGIVVTVPMPGHPYTSVPHSDGLGTPARSNEGVTIATLDQLVQTHDVVFALTDSRESRWIPTVLAASHKKILINCALGFDSYLVMRHGASPTLPGIDSLTSSRLGCYFCNDVVAAVNSQKDRTLDQQCTVTRPGLSFIAAGLAVELMVSLLQSPHGVHHAAPPLGVVNAAVSSTDETEVNIPHQIRGFLSSYSQMTVTSPAFDCCTACSHAVVNEYSTRGELFIREVCADVSGRYLEQLSGVTQLMANVNVDDFEDDDFEPVEDTDTLDKES